MKAITFIIIITTSVFSSCGQTQTINSTMKYKNLTPEEKKIIIDKGTEFPYTGIYDKFYEEGTYVCKQCGTPLYRSNDKFNSGCGWPSFDDEIDGAVKRIKDKDGRRTEIVCATCNGHLGHVFVGEHFTEKNTRHCVNSISLDFIPANNPKMKYDTAIFASGCFWGTEYWFEKQDGVFSTMPGYIGGHKDNPTYSDVCTGTTGHAEAVRVIFDPNKISYEALVKLFFETHDPEQTDGQGPDIGDQYRSEIFVLTEEQKNISQNIINLLVSKGMMITTDVTKATTFWEAEDYHRLYYKKKKGTPYCHIYTKRFN